MLNQFNALLNSPGFYFFLRLKALLVSLLPHGVLPRSPYFFCTNFFIGLFSFMLHPDGFLSFVLPSLRSQNAFTERQVPSFPAAARSPLFLFSFQRGLLPPRQVTALSSPYHRISKLFVVKPFLLQVWPDRMKPRLSKAFWRTLVSFYPLMFSFSPKKKAFFAYPILLEAHSFSA